MTIWVFDAGPLIDLFRHYYPARFPTLWTRFGDLVRDGRLTSTREVRNEIRGRNFSGAAKERADALAKWCHENAPLFPPPTVEELEVVRWILSKPHHHALIARQKRMRGGPVADPFVIARAKCVADACVVTTERRRPNAAKVPNVCDAAGVEWVGLEGFMEREAWSF